MKNIEGKLIKLLKKNYCVPSILKIAKKLKEPSSTIHYNIKKLEKEGKVLSYKAVFNYDKIGLKFTTFLLINLESNEYGNPEEVAKELSKIEEVESVNVITGDWELIVKVRVKDKNEYYELIKHILAIKGIQRIKSLVSLKEFKTNFVEIE